MLASAGSGKTYQLGNRILGSIALGVDAASITALTFTRKAAGEFTDSVLSKAADAVLDEHAAARLADDLGKSGRMGGAIDFSQLLERFVEALPRMVLGTMDGFFTKVVQAFPHEVGVHEGKIRLVEGAEWELRMGEVLGELLGERSVPQTEAFLEAFRQSHIGREVMSVRRLLDEFICEWHHVLRHDAGGLRWGPDAFANGVKAEDWNRNRHSFIDALRLAEVVTNHASQKNQWSKMLDAMAEHTTGSGRFQKSTLWEALLNAGQWRDCGRDIEIISYKKPMIFPAATWSILCVAMQQMAMSEIARVCQMTQAIRALIGHFDRLCEQRLRRRGMLCFDDIKVMMGQWTRGEDQRLAREALDFRLQARYRHWLLDEFQDTSRADWLGLFPLIDEAATAEDGSLFIVGDRKQAIYGWRGGDVKLFDEVERHYDAGLTREVMRESYRSCAEVLDCINRVFGNKEVIEHFFPHAAHRWVWEEHISAKPSLRGHACVRFVVDDDEDGDVRLDEMHADLQTIHAGENQLSVAVLVRTNDEMLQVADFLREHGYQVVEDGQRAPCEDHLIGVAIRHWFRWLADPGDQMANGVLRMSPIFDWLVKCFGEDSWQNCYSYAHDFGYAALVHHVVTPNMTSVSAFAQQRCLDAIDCMRLVDATGRASAKYAEESFAAYRVAHPPGPAQIQVMTIHKSKGLGFDVVFLPFVSNDKIPHEGRFEVAKGADWICKSPPSWVRSMSAEIKLAFDDWQADQQYEAMCLLYVALTRAKCGLYVYLDNPKAKAADKASYASWLASALQLDHFPRFEVGDFKNIAVSPMASPQTRISSPKLQPAQKILQSNRASANVVHHRSAAAFGTVMHEKWARFTWVDENQAAEFPIERDVANTSPTFSALFTRGQRSIDLFREVPIDGSIDGVTIHGILDRLHIHKDMAQKVSKIELIDFKSDQVDSVETLVQRHQHQMNIYKKLIALRWPGVGVDAYLVTRDGEVVVV